MSFENLRFVSVLNSMVFVCTTMFILMVCITSFEMWCKFVKILVVKSRGQLILRMGHAQFLVKLVCHCF
ncbi:hypothetical protein HanXRQr2_Chr17g0785321 [Helianthus annuus]|uniref:Uncharacterized protein n=1 Tax=Helianthus annuus TaxID=4232 RepID=A0A9K3DFB2_HELAN|nr:hypothetical protein HanXRQr2_Chr17g0785321 [Helianthus annuus]KAJ0811668.1 hypothetical protein HanPSC8_Chr17g0753291 [Helianthus annuus]